MSNWAKYFREVQKGAKREGKGAENVKKEKYQPHHFMSNWAKDCGEV